jgi:hypothetical protein
MIGDARVSFVLGNGSIGVNVPAPGSNRQALLACPPRSPGPAWRPLRRSGTASRGAQGIRLDAPSVEAAETASRR